MLNEPAGELHDYFTGSLDLLCIADTEGRFVRLNPEWQETLGYNVRELQGRSFLDFVHPDDVEKTRAATAALANAREIRNFQNRYRCKDGSYRWIEWRSRACGPLVYGVARDVTERKLIEEATQDRLLRTSRQMAAISCISRSDGLLNGDVEGLAREITEIAAEVTGVERANVWLFNEAEDELHCIDLYQKTSRTHSSGAVLRQTEFGNEFQALRSARYVDADDALKDARTAGYVESYLKPLGITSMLDAVVHASGKNMGLLCLEHVGQRHQWEPDEIGFACELADKIGVAMAHQRRLAAQAELASETKRSEAEIRRHIAQLEQSIQSAIAAVSMIGELRDPYTHGHQRRVGDIAAAVAAEMGLTAEQVEGVRVAGYLHDVGKIAVPAEILVKPGRLTECEFELVKSHSQKGYEILKTLSLPWPVAEAAWQHHERFDGSGYPRGLRGEDIAIEARVLAVADTIEAMAFHRPYRRGAGIEVALAEVERHRNKLYFPDVVDACLRLFREKGYRVPD